MEPHPQASAREGAAMCRSIISSCASDSLTPFSEYSHSVKRRGVVRGAYHHAETARRRSEKRHAGRRRHSGVNNVVPPDKAPAARAAARASPERLVSLPTTIFPAPTAARTLPHLKARSGVISRLPRP